ncbi:hypothetical protein [Bradyrhizobium sp. SZCCHNRI2010]|uniref:hypothetical protein n=1 Tax=Bradyrhizobium sp. SZCCHNRI2010 TaxID=3057283 RepID=UPI0028E4D5B5|nr:hypothetical protein [Bradyrhizobium sp. SZCCHNRI2010]
MIKLEDRRTWPTIGSLWTHTNGNLYQVVEFTNIETDRQDRYPTTIIYRNFKNAKLYSRPLVDWERSMTFHHDLLPSDQIP